ncbi:electron transport complex subunit RsxC [Marinospirillum perlucidum]|uniref:electron transport complex subunit RsxC n=1 Tax=Marinospirillum perlucidum TaxID=1982602 RepID=UPI00138FAF21|nr:electron transport complex subunit RsxC [Marinospirillum perlucidum]
MLDTLRLTNRRFHGGIHPPENKLQSSLEPLRELPLPNEVVLPLGQHQGQLAKPLVEIGEKVKTGQLLASTTVATGACVHASITGRITAIEDRPLPQVSGLSLPAIVIQREGEEESFTYPRYDNWQETPNEQLLERIQTSGLVGLGGAVFPTRTKLAGALEKGIETLIINAAECEPYITADDCLMQTRPAALLEGIGLLIKLLQPREVLLGIEDNKPQALESLQKALPGSGLEEQLQICVLPTLYPSGGEKQLIQLLTGKEVPSGGLPLDLGILCHNVGTLAALADAVIRGRPLIERIVTITGQAVSQPGNYLVRLGTAIETLLQAAGWNQDKHQRLILGGPMMGFTLPSAQVPVTKAANCLLLPTEEELPLPGPEQPCIRCGRCEEACPAQLLPQQLYFYAAHQVFDQAEEHQLFDCIECGACAWVCPSEIPLVQYYRYAKGEVRQLRADAEKAEQARLRFEARQERFEREQAEKEAKRQARAQAAAKLAAAQKAKQEAKTQQEPQTQSEQASSEPDVQAALTKKLKQLKTAKAASSVAVKKAEKGLANLKAAADTTPEQLSEQEAKLAKAKEQLQKAEQQLAEAEAGNTPAAAQPAPEVKPSTGNPEDPAKKLKQLKTAKAATAVAVKKAQKTLDNLKAAADSTPEQIAEQEDKLAKAQQQLQKTEQQLAEAEASGQPAPTAAPGQPTATPEDPAKKLKQLKTAKAATAVAVKKAEKALSNLQAAKDATPEQIAEQEEKLAKAREQLTRAETRLAQAEEE